MAITSLVNMEGGYGDVVQLAGISTSIIDSMAWTIAGLTIARPPWFLLWDFVDRTRQCKQSMMSDSLLCGRKCMWKETPLKREKHDTPPLPISPKAVRT